MAIAAKKLFLLGLSGVALATAVTFLLIGRDDTISAQCRGSTAAVARLKPLATGEMAAFQVAATPRLLPPLSFISPDGKAVSLADFAGRVTLVNLWATWCLPCRKEMPALDQLQAELGSQSGAKSGFEVVAINIDTRNLDRPRQWLAEAGIARLAYYSDPKANVFQELRAIGKATGMPTTLLVDANGCELGILQGAAEWASADALKLVRAALTP